MPEIAIAAIFSRDHFILFPKFNAAHRLGGNALYKPFSCIVLVIQGIRHDLVNKREERILFLLSKINLIEALGIEISLIFIFFSYYEKRGFKMIPHEYCGSGMRKAIHK